MRRVATAPDRIGHFFVVALLFSSLAFVAGCSNASKAPPTSGTASSPPGNPAPTGASRPGTPDSQSATASDETEAGGAGAGPTAGQASGAGTGETAGSPAGTARTPDERRAGLDGELDASLSEFDRKLLEEQREADREQVQQAEAEALERKASNGSPPLGRGTDPSGVGGAEKDDETGNTASSSGADSEGENTGARQNGVGSGADRDRIPDDIPDSSGDDIVARQLREAAVTEEDPELRARLWNEYRKYRGLPLKDAEPPSDPGDESTAGAEQRESQPPGAP